tara:strand:- start:164 stop:397 length:234 start_codon:yes stop_codon:yes gene_type:complete
MSENDNTKFEMTRDFIQKAKANTLEVVNNYESYREYFKMGGTVGKMTVTTAKRYQDLVNKRIESRDNENSKEVSVEE